MTKESIKNKHRELNRTEWAKLSSRQRVHYNAVYDKWLSMGQKMLKHPDAPVVSEEYWSVIRHNAAMVAAWKVE